MKKSLMLLSFGLGLTLAASGAETYREAFDAGRAAVREHNFAEAEKLFLEAEKLAANENEKANGILSRIDVVRAQKRPEEALKLSQSMDLDRIPRSDIRDAAYIKLARGYRELKHYDEAEKVLRKALAQEEKRFEENILNDLGYTLLQAQKFEEAEKAYKDALKLEIKNPNVLLGAKMNLANALNKQKKFEEAEKAYKDALKLEIKNPNVRLDAMLKLARVLNAQKKYEEAEKFCQDVLKDENKRSIHVVDAYTVIGDGARYAGNREKLREYYGKAIALPECPPSRKANLERLIEQSK